MNKMSNIDILFLNNKDMEILGIDDMKTVIHDIERAYILIEEGNVLIPGKCVMRWGNTLEEETKFGRINAMPGYIGGEYDMAGIKWIGSGPENHEKRLPRASSTVILNDPDTKLPVCIANGTMVSAKRTGASGGVAIRLLSRQDSRVMTICGAGAQGRTQLEASLIVRHSIKKVYIYDIKSENTRLFIEEMSIKYPEVIFIPSETLEAAIKESDIIITATLANDPFVHSGWLKKGALLLNLADYEVTYDCVRIADKIIVDNWEAIKHRMISTVAMMWKEGMVRDKDIHAELGEILLGKKIGRDTEDQIIYFNAVGLGILDLAIITRAYRKAIEQGIGTKIVYWKD